MSHILLDTHIVLQWVVGSRQLTQNQASAIETASRRGEPIGISAISLLEIAILTDLGRIRIQGPFGEFLQSLEVEPYRVYPLTADIAVEAGGFRILKDPTDRAIAATARVHGLRLVTSDQRIIDSNLVSTIQ